MQDTTQNAIHGGDSHAYTDPLAIALLSGVGKYDQGSNSLNFQEIRALVDEPQEVPKGEARWCIPSTLQSRDKKRQMNEGQFVALWGDIDAPGIHTIESIAQAVAGIVCGCDFEVYATKSATEETQKCRILVPLAFEITPHQWLTAQAVLNEKISAVLGIDPDKANGTANQVFFLPNRGDYYASNSQREGRYLAPLSDWARDMAEHHERQARDREAVKKAQEAAQKARQELQAARTTQGFKSAIDAFNAAHYVGDILTQQGYDQNPINPNLYRHPNSESGNYSASVQRDAKGVARVHSLSSADPLYTGGGGTGAHDAFSAFAVLAHNGNRDAALKDAGDNWLAIGGENWNAVQRREYAQTMAHERANAGFDPLDLVDPDTGEIAPSFQRVSVADVRTAPSEPPSFVWGSYLPRRVVSLLSAHGGTGKSMLSLMLAVSVAVGDPFMGAPTQKSKVIFLSLEDDGEVVRHRLSKICDNWFLDPEDLAESLIILDGTEDPELYTVEGGRNAAGITTRLYKALREEAQGAGLVIVDNASDAYGGDEIQRRQVRGFIRALAHIAKENDAAVLLLAHVDKSVSRGSTLAAQGENYSGSTAWHNSVRSRMFLASEGNNMLRLTHEKSNLGAKAQPISMEWPEGGLPQLVAQGFDMGSGQSKSEQKTALLRLIYEFTERGESVGFVQNSRNNAAKLFESEPTYPKGLRKAEVFALLREAQRESLLEKENYRTPNRKEAERWKLTEAGKRFIGAGSVVGVSLAIGGGDLVGLLDAPSAPSAPSVSF